MSNESAEHVAALAFAFLAEDKVRIGRFLDLTGISSDALAGLVGERTFLAGVLDHLMGDDALILAFCANFDLKPNDVKRAHRLLVGVEAGEHGVK